LRASRRLLAVPAALAVLVAVAAPGLATESMVEATVGQGEEVTRTLTVPEGLLDDLEGANINIDAAGEGGAEACAEFTTRLGDGAIQTAKVDGAPPETVTVTLEATARDGDDTPVGDHTCTLELTVTRPGEEPVTATIAFVLHVTGAEPEAMPTPEATPAPEDTPAPEATPVAAAVPVDQAAGGGTLPFTGSAAPLLLAVGGGLLAAGGALLTAARRRVRRS
jgi:hypothetical protein